MINSLFLLTTPTRYQTNISVVRVWKTITWEKKKFLNLILNHGMLPSNLFDESCCLQIILPEDENLTAERMCTFGTQLPTPFLPHSSPQDTQNKEGIRGGRRLRPTQEETDAGGI